MQDEALRVLVVEWLDDKPSLAKKEAEVLRLAAERSEGWEEEVARLTPKIAPKKGGGRELDALRERAERERTKTTQARAEARKIKEESRAVLQAERKRADELERALSAVERELEKTQALLKTTATLAVKEKDVRDREARRERRDAERARGERNELKEQLQATRKETTELRRTIRALERRLAAAGAAAKKVERRPSSGGRPRKRRALRAPHGLFEEAPETLISWLKVPGVHVLIDGYNVTKAQDGFGDLHLPDQRDRLIDEVARLGRKYEVIPMIVFDGSEVPGGTRRKTRLPVAVEYSSPDEIADDHLVARLSDLPPDPVIVVTNDRELQDRARAEGATIATSNQLLALVR